MHSDEVICIHTTNRASHAGIIGFQTRRGMGWPVRRAARMTAQGLMRFFIDRRGTPAYLAVSSERNMLTLSARTDDGLVTDELLRLPECLASMTHFPRNDHAEHRHVRDEVTVHAGIPIAPEPL